MARMRRSSAMARVLMIGFVTLPTSSSSDAGVVPSAPPFPQTASTYEEDDEFIRYSWDGGSSIYRKEVRFTPEQWAQVYAEDRAMAEQAVKVPGELRSVAQIMADIDAERLARWEDRRPPWTVSGVQERIVHTTTAESLEEQIRLHRDDMLRTWLALTGDLGQAEAKVEAWETDLRDQADRLGSTKVRHELEVLHLGGAPTAP